MPIQPPAAVSVCIIFTDVACRVWLGLELTIYNDTRCNAFISTFNIADAGSKLDKTYYQSRNRSPSSTKR